MADNTSSRERVNMATESEHPGYDTEKKHLEASQIERVMTPDTLHKDGQDYNRIDVSTSHPAELSRCTIVCGSLGGFCSP